MDETAVKKNFERMRKVIEMTPFMRHLGMEFVEAEEGCARLKLRYQQENSTFGDALHGGAIASLIDTTGAMAAWTTAEIATPRYFGSTVGCNVNYLSGAIGEDIFAEGRVLKRGKEIIYSDVRVTNPAGKLLAQGTVVYRIVERE
ncbi:MAG: PaaI family thioesterase [Dehalococcoidia bacterium]|nr:PaaI family thioesterase [Dehalococcoidia bacterium]